MQVDPTTRNAAIALTAIGGGALTLLIAKLWARRSLEVLAIGTPVTIVATVLVARNLEARVQEVVTEEPEETPPTLAERVQALHDLQQGERISTLQALAPFYMTQQQKELLWAYFEAHGVDDLCHFDGNHLYRVARAFGGDLAFALKVGHALKQGGVEEKAGSFLQCCPVNTFLQVCVTCQIEPKDWTGFREEFEAGEVDANLLLQLWRSGNGREFDILYQTAKVATTFEAFANACTDQELLKLATRWTSVAGDYISFLDRSLVDREVPLGELEFCTVQHLPNYLRSLPRAELYGTVSKYDREKFIHFFAGDRFDGLPVKRILGGEDWWSAEPKHVRAYVQLRQVCGLQTSVRELLAYRDTLGVDLPDFEPDELQALGLAQSQEEFDKAVLAYEMETGSVDINRLTEKEWRKHLETLAAPQSFRLMDKIARAMPRLAFLAYSLQGDAGKMNGELKKLPSAPNFRTMRPGILPTSDLSDWERISWAKNFVEMERREAWQEFLGDYFSQQFYRKRHNIVGLWVASVIGTLHTPEWLAGQFNDVADLVLRCATDGRMPAELKRRATNIGQHLNKEQRDEFEKHLDPRFK